MLKTRLRVDEEFVLTVINSETCDTIQGIKCHFKKEDTLWKWLMVLDGEDAHGAGCSTRHFLTMREAIKDCSHAIKVLTNHKYRLAL